MTSVRELKRLTPSFLLAALLILTGSPRATAQLQQTWTNTGGTFSWNLPGNWTTAVPGSTDLAVFTNTGVGAVTLDANQSIKQLLFTNTTGSYDIAPGGPYSLTIGSGIVSTGTAANGISANVVLGASQVWDIGNSSSLSVGGIISDGGSGFGITKSGTGTLTLSGNNSFSGTVTLNNGTLVATGSANALGGGNLVLAGASLQLTNASGSDLNFGRNTSITGNATIISDVSGGSAGNNYTLGTLSIGANRLTINGGGNVSSGVAQVTFGATALTGAAIFIVNNPANGGTTVLSLGAVSNGANTATINGNGSVVQTGVWGTGATPTGGITYNGAGTLTLNQANLFTGVLNVAGGTVVGTANSLALGSGSAANGITLLAGTLRLTNPAGTNLDFSNAGTTGNTTVSGYSMIVSDVNAAGAANTYTLGALAIGAQQLNVIRGNNATGTAGVTFGGVASLGATGATFNVGANANLTLNTLTGAQHFWKTGSGTLTLASASGVRATLNAFVTGGTLALYGVGNGTTADSLGSAANTPIMLFSGTTLILGSGTAAATSVAAHPTTILGSTTIISDANAAATAGFTQTLGALTIFNATTLTIGTGANVSGGAPAVAFAAATTNGGGANFSVNTGSQLTLNSTLNNGGYTATFSGAGNSTVTGAISGGGGLTMSGTGLLTLTAANTYGGQTTIGSGTVTLGNATSLGAAATANLSMTGASTLNLNASGGASAGISVLNISTGANTTIQNGSSATAAALTVTPGANNTSVLGGALANGGAATLALTVNGQGAVTLSGSNTYGGTTTLTAGQLNINSAGALSSNSAFTLTTGILDNTTNATVNATYSNTITLGGNFAYGGSQSLSLGSATMSQAASRTVALYGSGTLTMGAWNNTAVNVVNTFVTLPGATSSVTISSFNFQTTGATGTGGINGNSNVSVVNGINPSITASAFAVNNTGTITVTGNSNYTGVTTINAGTLIFDNSGAGATLTNANVVTLGGGQLQYKGGSGGSTITFGNITLAAAGASSIQVVGGASGTTTLAVGTLANATNNSMLNINYSNNNSFVTTSTGNTNDNLFGTRGSITVTTGGTTEFATRNGSNQLVQYIGQTAFVGSGGISTTNYKLTDSGTVTSSQSFNSLRIVSTQSGQSLDLGTQLLSLTSGGILFTGSNDYEIKGTGVQGLRSTTAATGDLIIHNFSNKSLTISAVIGNNTGVSVVSLDGPGTTALTGVNTYTGVTQAGGGAVVSIGANSGLGAVATGAALTLNNATLQATSTFGLFNGAAGTNDRAITLAAGGGTFQVTGSNALTVSGVISSTGSLTKTDSGTLVITGAAANTYSGPFTSIQNGTVVLAKTGAVANLTATTTLVLGATTDSSTGATNTSGVLQLGNSTSNVAANVSQIVANLLSQGSGTGNAIIGGYTGGTGVPTFTYAGAVSAPGFYSGSIGAGANSITGTSGGTAAANNINFTLTSGALTLSGASTYTGVTTLTAGVLNINNASALSTSAIAWNGASIDSTVNGGITMTTNNTVTLGGNVTFGGSNSLSFGSTSVLNMGASRTITLLGSSSNSLTFGTLNVTANALTLTVNAPQSAGSVLSVGTLDLNTSATAGTTTVAGTGTLQITGSITASGSPMQALTINGQGITVNMAGTAGYTGLTTITLGTLELGTGGSLSSTGGLTLGAVGAVFDLNGVSTTVGGTLTNTLGMITNSNNTAATFTANAIATSTGHFGGNLNLNITQSGAAATLSGNFSNTGDVTFTNTGSGTLTVSSPNFLTGGNVSLNANVAQAIAISAVNFNPNGTVTNSGTGTGTTTISGVLGSNITAINQNSNSSPLTISGAWYLNPSGITVTSSATTGTAALVAIGTATINGVGNLTLLSSATGGGAFTLSAVPSYQGDLTLTSNGSSNITVSGATNNSGTIINNGTGTNTTTISGIIGLPVTGVIQNSATSLLVLSGANTFTGGLVVKSGQVTGTVLGAFGPAGNTLTLGDTAGSANATAFMNLTGAWTVGAISVAAGNTGVATLSAAGASPTSAATITLNSHDLVLSNGSTTGWTLSGPVSSTGTGGSVTINSTAAGALTLSGLVNIAGTVTSNNAGAVTLSGGVGANVTAINLGSGAGALSVTTGGLAVNSGGTTLNSASAATFTLGAGAVTGVGNLVVNANSTGNFTISAPMNHVGTFTNSGTGTGTVTYSGIIGTNVTGVIQNSTTSALTLSGANTFAGGLTILSGTVNALTSASALGTGVVTLGNNATVNANPVQLNVGTNSLTFANPIVLADRSKQTGTITLGIVVTTVGTTYSGGVTGNNDLILYEDTTGSSGRIAFTVNPVNNSGTVTVNGANTFGQTAATSISSVGSNVTQLVVNNNFSGLAVTALAVNSGGTTLVNNATAGTVTNTVSGAVNGTGDLILKNNSAIANGITLSGTVANSGTITNSGSGSGLALVSAAVTAGTGGITAINQNSDSSALTVSGAITLGGGTLTINSNGNTGTAALLTVGAGAITGTGNVVFNANTAGNISVSATSATGNIGTITNSGTGGGTVTVSGVLGTNVAGVIQNSGTSLLILSAANTFTGNVTINNAGTVRATGNAGALGAGAAQVVMTNGTVLQIFNDAALNLARNLTFTGNVQVTTDRVNAGTGVTHTLGALVISNQTLTAAGGPNASAGTQGLTFGATTITGSPTFVVNNGGGGAAVLLTLGATTAGANSVTVNGNTTGGMTLGATTFASQNAITVQTGTTGTSAAVTLGAVTLAGRSFTFNNSSTNGGTLTTAALTVAAGTSPTLTFTGGGPITTAAITLAAGTFGNTITNTNTGLTNLNGALTIGSPTTINSSSAAGMTIASVAAGVNPLTFTGSGNVTISGALGNTGFFGNAGSGNVTVSGITTPASGNLYSNTGSGSLTFGNFTLANINSQFTGTSAITAGVYTFTSTTSSTLSNSNTASLTFDKLVFSPASGNGTLANNGGALTINNGVEFTNAAATTSAVIVSGTGTTIINGNIGLNTGGGTNTSGGVTVGTTGNGSLTLSGANVFTGVVTVNAGAMLRISGNNNLGANTTGARLTLAGGTLQVTDNVTLAAGSAGVTVGTANSFISVDSGKTLTINQVVTLPAFTLTTTGAGDTTVGTGGSINLTGAGGLANTGTGTFTIGGGGITGTQNLTLSGTGAITINGVVGTGTGAVALNGNGGSSSGAGTITFNNANTYAGLTTVNAGTLVGKAQASGSPFGTGGMTIFGGTVQLDPRAAATSSTSIGALTASGGATFFFNSTANSGANQTELVAASLARATAGTIVFNTGAGTLGTAGTNDVKLTFTAAPVARNGIILPWAVTRGSANANADFLATGGASALGTVTALPQSGSTSTVVYQATADTNITASQSVSDLKVTNATVSGNAGTVLTLAGGNATAGLILNGTSSITVPTLTFAASQEGLLYVGDTATISSSITGNTGLTVFGPGTLNLTAGSGTTLTGTVTIENATLALTNTSNLNNNAISLRGTLSIAGTSTFSQTGTITAGVGGGSIVVAGGSSDVTLGLYAGTANAPVTITNNGSGTLKFSGVSTFGAGLATTTAGNVTFSGAYTATTAGAIQLVVSGGVTTLDYTGATNSNAGVRLTDGTLLLKTGAAGSALNTLAITSGTARFGNDTTSGVSAMVSATLTLANGTLDINGFNGAIGALAGTGGTVTNSVGGAKTLTINGTAVTTFAGVIQDGSGVTSVTLAPTAANLLTLTGVNTYSGTTTINSLGGAGGIVVGNANALQNSAVVNNNVVSTGLSFSALATGLTSANIGSLSGAGTTALVATTNFQLNVGGFNTDTIYSGTINTGLANAYLNKVGTGTWFLAAQSTYLGYTNVSNGAISIGMNNALPTTTILNVAASKQFLMNGFNQTVAGLYGSGAVATGSAVTGTLTVGSANTSIFGGSITGSGGLTKVGAGTMTLTGGSTYTGATVITAGALNLDFSAATPPTSVLASSSAVTLNGGILNVTAPVTGSATQSLGGVSIAANTNGQISLANTVSAASLTLNLGDISRGAGSVLNITMPTVGTNTLNTTAGGASGLLTDTNGTAFAVINGTDWAVKSGNAITTATYTTNAFGSGVNTDVSGATATLNGTTASLRFSAATVNTLTLNGNTTLTSGGILVTAAVGNSAQTITGGFNLAGPSGGDFVVVQNGGNGNLRIDANLVDGSGGATGLTKMGANALVLTGTNTFSGNISILSGGLTIGTGTTGSINNAGNIVNNGTLTFNTNVTNTLAGNISGTGILTNTAGNLTVTGNISGTIAVTNTAGNMTLNGLLSYTGATTLAATSGTVIIGGANGAAFTSAIALNGGTLQANDNNALANAPVTQAGSGALTFGAGITAPVIGNLASAANVGTVSLQTTANESVNLSLGARSIAASYGGTFTGSGSLTKVGTAVLTLNSTTASSFTGTAGTVIQQGGITLSFTAASQTNILPATALTLGGTTGGVPTSGTLTLTNVASSSVSQSFSGTTLATTTANTISVTNSGTNMTLNLGAITRNTGSILNIVSSGTTAPVVTSGTGTGGALLTDANGAVYATVGNDWAARDTTTPANIVGLSTIAGGYTNDTLGAGVNSNITVTGSLAGTQANVLRFSNAATAALTLSSGGTFTITTGGVTSGTLAATISGATSIQSGSNQLFFQKANANVTLAINGDLIDNASLTTPATNLITNNLGQNIISLTGRMLYTGTTTINGATTRFAPTTSFVWGTSSVVNNGILSFNIASGLTNTLNAPISGSGSVNLVTGTGTTIFGGANTFTGGLTIFAGVLQLTNDSALPTTGAFSFGVSGTAITAASTLDLNGTNQTIASLSAVTTQAIAATITNTSTTKNSTLTFGDATNQIYNAVIANGASRTTAIVKQGTGMQTFQGVNTFTGGTTINGGTVNVVQGAKLSGVGALAVNNGASLLLNTGAVESFGNLSGTGAASRIALAPGTTLSLTQTGTTTYAGSITGNGGLTLASGSTGSLTLTGASNYTGATNVQRGTLVVGVGGAGSLGNTSVTVGTTGPSPTVATLQGTGTIGGSVTVNSGSFLKAGNSPGVLTVVGNTNMAAGSNLNVDVAFDGMNSVLDSSRLETGTFTFVSGLVINLGATTGVADGVQSYTFTIVQTQSSSGITFNNSPASPSTPFVGGTDYTVNFGTGFSGYSVTSLMVGTDMSGYQNLQLTVATPEPHHILLVCVCVLLAGYAIRRRLLVRRAEEAV